VEWPNAGCVRADASYCVTGEPAGYGWVNFCDPNTFTPSTTIGACRHLGEDSEICGDSIDNNWNGCADEGCTIGWGSCTCQASCDKTSCTSPPLAGCDPLKKEETEYCDGKDNNCDGNTDEDCEPPRCDGGSCSDPARDAGAQGGKDPILLGWKNVITLPYTDFEATAVTRLSMRRTYNSNDGMMFGDLPPIFGTGWRHEWEAALSCEEDRCTVGRGGRSGLEFTKAETALSVDGAETLQMYRPATQGRSRSQRNLLVRRPSGEWILHESDGATLHFESVCDPSCPSGCGGPSCADTIRACAPPESGGIARLVKRVDPQGNAVHVRYAPGESVLIGLSDDLGHLLEVRSDGACQQKARRLFYDGFHVASYTYGLIDDGFGGLAEGPALEAVRDVDERAMRTYAYQWVILPPRGNVLIDVAVPFLTGVFDEAGGLNVEFAYGENMRATGISDDVTTMTIAYGDDDVATVTESFGAGTSTCRKTFDAKGTLLSVTDGCSDGPARSFTYSGGEPVCTRDAVGNVTYDGRDALGRTVRHARYSGSTTCPPPATLGGSFEDETRTYGVTKQVAQGVGLELDNVASVSRRSSFSSGWTSESWDYEPGWKSIDPVGYECAEAPLPAGAVVCRQIESGYIRSSTGGALLERHATFYSHDGRGRVTRVIGPINLDYPSATDVVPVEERIYWPDDEPLARRGRLAEIRRYASPTTPALADTFDYDAFGLYRWWQPDGAAHTYLKDGRGRTQYVLRADGRAAEVRYHDGEKPRLVIGAGGEVARVRYDGRGRMTSLERLSGDPEATGGQVSVLWGEYHQYDAAGNRVHSERRDADGAVVWKQDREFDVQRRLVRATHPEDPSLARTWDWTPSGFLASVTDEEGRTTTFAPEFLGRVKSVTRSGFDAAGAPVSQAVATYTYTAYSGSLLSVKDDRGVTTYRRDDFDRTDLMTKYMFLSGSISPQWDARGNLLREKDTWRTVNRTYDGLDRLLTVSAANGIDGNTVAYAYRYDEGGFAGHLTSVAEPERTVRFTYGVEGRLETERLEESGVATPLVTEYQPDALGRLSVLVYPTGLRLEHVRDGVSGEVIALRNADTGQVYAGSVARLAGGPVTSLYLANNTVHSQGFNLRWEPTSAASGPVSLAYTPTPAGDVGQIVENGLPLPFTYDFQDRLAGSEGWFTYGYDGNGNRSTEWVEGQSLTNTYAWDRLTTASTPGATPVKRYAFGYDAQTNVSGIGKYNETGSAVASSFCLRHDVLGRLVMAGPSRGAVYPDALVCGTDSTLASVSARFKYDFRNRRVAAWRAETGEWVYTVFDQGGQPLAELAKTTDPANPWRAVREYVWLDGKPVAQIEHDPATGTARTYAVHTDALGMPRALTSPAGAVVWVASVPRPFGDIEESTVPDPETGKTVVTNLRLPGQYDERLLASVGLQGPYYNWNRWYLPSVGRYLELDPIAKAGGFNGFYGPNWYGYAEGNPLTNTDPWGLTTYWCTSPLHALKSKCGTTGKKSCSDADLNPLFHNYFCVDTGNGPPQCGGKDYDPWFPSVGDGKPSDDKFRSDSCRPYASKNKCFDDCVLNWIDPATPRGTYILGVWDCQTYVKQGERLCAVKCGV
jgi:RHS repeat-associated protein